MSEPIAPTRDEIVYVDGERTACDGPPDGRHPRVYLTMTDEGYVVCPYCSRVFQQR